VTEKLVVSAPRRMALNSSKVIAFWQQVYVGRHDGVITEVENDEVVTG
jgi:hypothetical protein